MIALATTIMTFVIGIIAYLFYTKRNQSKTESIAKVEIEYGDSQENSHNLSHNEFWVCPHCGKRKSKLELLCYYRFDDGMWSDYRHLLPQSAQPAMVQHCPNCDKYYAIQSGPILIQTTENFEFIEPVSFEYFKKCYASLSSLKMDEIQEFNHRLWMISAYNDDYYRTPIGMPTEEDKNIHKENLIHICQIIPLGFGKAEFLREAGLFEECLSDLDKIEQTYPNDEELIANIKLIRIRAKNHDQAPFRIDTLA